MSVLQALDIGLALLVFAVAAWTIFARGAFPATVGYVVYGLLLSLVWIRLFAVDVALTEAAIGSGVTGILLISAAARTRGAETAGRETSLSGLARLAIAGLCILVALALAGLCCCCPIKARHWRRTSMQHLHETGLGNPVTEFSLPTDRSTPCSKRWRWDWPSSAYRRSPPTGTGAPGEPRAEHPEPTLGFLAQMSAGWASWSKSSSFGSAPIDQRGVSGRRHSRRDVDDRHDGETDRGAATARVGCGFRLSRGR